MSNEQNESGTKAHPVDTLVINAEAPTVKKIWISQNIDRSELRIDWSNDIYSARYISPIAQSTTFNRLRIQIGPQHEHRRRIT